MDRFEIETPIDRPVPEVFDALRRLDELPVWTPGVLEIRRTGTASGPAEVGTTGVFVGRLLGRSFESQLRYSEVVPDQVVALETTSGPFRLDVRAVVEAAGSGSLLHTRVSGEGHGFLKLVEPAVAPLVRRYFETALSNLGELLDSHQI